MSIPLFFNNTARSTRASRFRKWLEGYQDLFTLIEPSSADDMRNKLKEQADLGVPVVAVAGGDGTLGVAADALCNSDTSLALFPAGTVNVFSRQMDIHKSFQLALKAVQGGKIREVDVFALNGKPFLQMAGIGIDARSVELTTWEMKKKWKSMAYVLSGARAMIEKQPHLTLVTDQGRTVEGRAILFGNGRLYAGSFEIFSEANNTDGLLDVIVFKKTTPFIIKECLLSLVYGGFNHHRYGDFEYLRITGGTVTTDSHAPCELDGDYAGNAPADITYCGKLKVFAP